MMVLVKQLMAEEQAATAIEYGLIAALVGLAIAGGVSQFADILGNSTNGTVTQITAILNNP
jgi:pilus assembly protein Flp/PilA